MLSDTEKQIRKKRSRDRLQKVQSAFLVDEQNRQLVRENFCDNANFKNNASQQDKKKYFDEHMKVICYAFIYQTDIEYKQFDDFLMGFYQWLEKIEFPLDKRSQSTAKKQVPKQQKNEMKIEETLKTQMRDENQQKYKPKQQIVQRPTILPPGVQQKQPYITPSKPQHQQQRGVLPSPSSAQHLPKQGPTQGHANKSRPQDNYYPPNQHAEAVRPSHKGELSKQQMSRKIMSKLFDCFDHHERRHKLLIQIKDQIEEMKKIQKKV